MQLNYNGILRQIRYLNYDKVVDSHCHIDTDIYTDTERNDAITTALDYKIVMITSPLTRNERNTCFTYAKKIYKLDLHNHRISSYAR